ncbi:hypothetical protein EVAR_3903_1 [Eumeta japonica]|uniref:Uncharacterized protein n=1 Tax=Eumeta variegata TaxID=151549 RepID=A0A4C1STK5_EUMVA|nr:hypothetical protein EVAR_3903_1 [Eumeta japonica]
MERRCQGIKLKNKVSFTETRNKSNVIDALLFMKKRKWKWAGDVARHTGDGRTVNVTKGKGPKGSRSRHRSNTRYQDELAAIAGKTWIDTAKESIWQTSEVTSLTKPINK